MFYSPLRKLKNPKIKLPFETFSLQGSGLLRGGLDFTDHAPSLRGGARLGTQLRLVPCRTALIHSFKTFVGEAVMYRKKKKQRKPKFG